MKELVIDNFIADTISYLDGRFSQENSLKRNKRPEGKQSFDKSLIASNFKPYYVVTCMDCPPESESFNNVLTLSVMMQIDVFSLAGHYQGNEYLANKMSVILQGLISKYMEDLKFECSNKNIILMREVASSPAIPYEDGNRAYFSSLRYRFVIMRDYEQGN